jgi:hypothetical protein
VQLGVILNAVVGVQKIAAILVKKDLMLLLISIILIQIQGFKLIKDAVYHAKIVLLYVKPIFVIELYGRWESTRVMAHPIYKYHMASLGCTYKMDFKT